MSISAQVVDGKLVESSSASSLSSSSSTSKSNSGMDKEAFLNLLVAEMQNQDPLEPTSNTEYVSQFATFSQLEEMQNMGSSVEQSRAQELVGQTVIMKVTSSTTGDTTYVKGKVDYVVYEDGESYLSINNALYSMDDLDTVIDADYLKAYDLSTSFVSDLKDLPTVANVTLSDQEDIEALEKTYEGMTDYQKSFLSEDTVKSYKEYVDKLNELIAAKKAAESSADSTEEEATE